MSAVTSVLLALIGFTVQSTGLVLTKAGSPWLKWEGERDARYRRSLVLWFFGFLLYNSAFIFTGLASRTLAPHVVSAISGWGIPVMVISSHLLLREALYRSDILCAGGIVAGIALLSLLERPDAAPVADLRAFYILLLAPLPLLIPALSARLSGRVRTALLAVFAGALSGFTLVIMNVMVKAYGADLSAYLRSPYPYLFIAVGTAAFVALQMALRLGELIVVGPLQNALLIIYPAICSWLVFGVRLGAAQIAVIAAILACCLAILRRH